MFHDELQLYTIQGVSTAFIQMKKWMEKSKYLLALCVDNGITIEKYYWRSIYDNTYIEYIEPNIVDAFTMCIDISGDPNVVHYVLNEYNKVAKALESITIVEPLTDKEIKEIAQKAFQNMVIFS